jgi:hypothetical protein
LAGSMLFAVFLSLASGLGASASYEGWFRSESRPPNRTTPSPRRPMALLAMYRCVSGNPLTRGVWRRRGAVFGTGRNAAAGTRAWQVTLLGEQENRARDAIVRTCEPSNPPPVQIPCTPRSPPHVQRSQAARPLFSDLPHPV